MFLFPFPLQRRSGGSKKKKAPSKLKEKYKLENPNATYYSKLTTQQLTSLLEAINQPKSGTKTAQIQRLAAHPVASAYKDQGNEGRVTYAWAERHHHSGDDESNHLPGQREGVTLSCIKGECKKLGLKVSGNRFDLVLRLLQYKTDPQAAVEAGATAKRSAAAMSSSSSSSFSSAGAAGAPVTETKEGGSQEPPKKKRKPNAPNVNKLTDRMESKIYKDDSKWSNFKIKHHACDVLQFAAKLIQTEAIDKGYASNGDPMAWAVVEAVMEPILEGFESRGIATIGYASWDLRCLCDGVLTTIVKATPDSVLPKLKSVRETCLDPLFKVAKDYGMDDEFEELVEAMDVRLGLKEPTPKKPKVVPTGFLGAVAPQVAQLQPIDLRSGVTPQMVQAMGLSALLGSAPVVNGAHVLGAAPPPPVVPAQGVLQVADTQHQSGNAAADLRAADASSSSTPCC